MVTINNYLFSERSVNNLKQVHPDMVKLAYKALNLSTVDFSITEGTRTIDKQKNLVKEGESKTLNSRHLSGHAIDVLACPTPTGSWDFKYYQEIAIAFKNASVILNIPVEWGGLGIIQGWAAFSIYLETIPFTLIN